MSCTTEDARRASLVRKIYSILTVSSLEANRHWCHLDCERAEQWRNMWIIIDSTYVCDWEFQNNWYPICFYYSAPYGYYRFHSLHMVLTCEINDPKSVMCGKHTMTLCVCVTRSPHFIESRWVSRKWQFMMNCSDVLSCIFTGFQSRG